MTARAQLADELRQTKDFLERLIDSLGGRDHRRGHEGPIILFNKGAEAICGYTAEEALGRAQRPRSSTRRAWRAR